MSTLDETLISHARNEREKRVGVSRNSKTEAFSLLILCSCLLSLFRFRFIPHCLEKKRSAIIPLPQKHCPLHSPTNLSYSGAVIPRKSRSQTLLGWRWKIGESTTSSQCRGEHSMLSRYVSGYPRSFLVLHSAFLPSE